MSEPKYQVRNWRKFQTHADGRDYKWLKLHRELLDNAEYHVMPEMACKYLPLVWILGSENNGELPELSKIAFRLRVKPIEANDILQTLAEYRFVEVCRSLCDPVQDSTKIYLDQNREDIDKNRIDPPLPPVGGSVVEQADFRLDSPTADPVKVKVKRKREPKAFPVCKPFEECCAELPALWNDIAVKAGLGKCPDPLTPDNVKHVAALWDGSPLFRDHWRDMPAAFAHDQWYVGIRAGVAHALRIRRPAGDGIPFEIVYQAWVSRPAERTYFG